MQLHDSYHTSTTLSVSFLPLHIQLTMLLWIILIHLKQEITNCLCQQIIQNFKRLLIIQIIQ